MSVWGIIRNHSPHLRLEASFTTRVHAATIVPCFDGARLSRGGEQSSFWLLEVESARGCDINGSASPRVFVQFIATSDEATGSENEFDKAMR